MSAKSVDVRKLNEAIEVAEQALKNIEDSETFRAKRKRKRINNALEGAYETLNKSEYGQKEVDKRTDDIWDALVDSSPFMMLFIFFCGFLLSGAVAFTLYQAYSFIEKCTDSEFNKNNPPVTPELSSLVNVEYVEDSIVQLVDQMSVSDAKGLLNPSQKFTIRNNSDKVGGLQYLVNYEVKLVPLNDPSAKLISPKYIKYRYTYKDYRTGKFYESPIKTLEETKMDKGTYIIDTGTQGRDGVTEYNVVFWISSLAPDEEMSSTYTFQFKVDAAIANG